MRHTFMIAAALAIVAFPAGAHPVFAQPEARAGDYWVGELRVGHGCNGSATTSIRVEVPEALIVARPQAKPGWIVTIEHASLASPVAGEGGRMLTERVSAVTWTGRLPDNQFDTFGLAAKLPQQTGELTFNILQTCEQGEVSWSESAGPDGHRPAHPPARLRVSPPADHAHH
ncbi:YcnI family protein [Brevundimonas sp. 2R-24]|uniref:YcnI family protein n=1 Tax=Peiella sedimenti TaxID=3061083 RepID=A0ABT8SNK2_9CAUL|nr:YcnI family protein [Caulobacteraceae bacterium XZ-24]